jgi:hypothetical protein
MKFLANILSLLDASLDIETNINITAKLKLRMIKDKRVATEENSDEMIITFANIYESMDTIILLKEFNEKN